MRHRLVLRLGLVRQPQIPTQARKPAAMTGPQIIYALIIILVLAVLLSRL